MGGEGLHLETFCPKGLRVREEIFAGHVRKDEAASSWIITLVVSNQDWMRKKRNQIILIVEEQQKEEAPGLPRPEKPEASGEL